VIKLGNTFEAIDFDYAFVVKCENEQQREAYELTRQLIRYWLSV